MTSLQQVEPGTTLFKNDSSDGVRSPGVMPLEAADIVAVQDDAITVVRKCTPFYVRVMVYSPESGYRFHLRIQKSCDSNNAPIWKMRFDLDRTIDGKFVRVVEVEVGVNSSDPPEVQQKTEEQIKKTVDNGINDAQAETLVNDVFPATKDIAETTGDPTPDQAKKATDGVKKVISEA
jgi:hypothetical protein